MAITLAATPVSRALIFETEITPENAQSLKPGITITVSDALGHSFKINEAKATNGAIPIPVNEPTAAAKVFRVVFTPGENELPPVGVLSFYRDGVVVASCPVVGAKLAPDSKEVVPSAVDKSLAFEFVVSPQLFLVAKFEIYCYPLVTNPKLPPTGFSRYWFYASNFFPKK